MITTAHTVILSEAKNLLAMSLLSKGASSALKTGTQIDSRRVELIELWKEK